MTDALSRTSILKAFRTRYSRTARVFRAPARINIIGEHCDYNDGFVMPTNTALYTWLAIAPRADGIVRIASPDFGEELEVGLGEIQRGTHGDWREYPKGVLQGLLDEGHALTGADILISGEIPIGGGLSSSASLESVLAYAMLACAGIAIDRKRLALLCRQAENEFVGVACGIMDQYVISLCDHNRAMMLDCRSLDYRQAELPAGVAFLIVNSGVRHQLSAGGYNTRREECEAAVALLAQRFPNVAALRDVDYPGLNSCRDQLGDVLFRRSRHVVTEIQRVRDAHRALLANDAGLLGSLMNRSHDSLRDDYQVSCEEVDALVEITRNCRGVHGSRMVGAGFGGCTVSLVESASVDAVRTEIRARYGKILGHDPWCHVVTPSDPVIEVEAS